MRSIATTKQFVALALSLAGLYCCSFLLVSCDTTANKKSDLLSEANSQSQQIIHNDLEPNPQRLTVGKINSIVNERGTFLVNGRNRLRRSPNAKLRSKGGRTYLAQRPKTSTTSTTSTTSSPSTTSASQSDSDSTSSTSKEKSDSNSADDESSAGDDYEDISSPSSKRPKESITTTSKIEAKEETEVEEEEGEEESEESGATSTSTKASVTTTATRGAKTQGRKANKQASGKGGAIRPKTNEPKDEEPDESREPEKEEEESESKNGKGTSATGRQQNSGEESISSAPASTSAATSTSTSKDKMVGGRKRKKKPLVTLPFIRPKNASVCIPEAYLEFPRDLIGDKWRSRGLIVVHVVVVCYMFYSLALVCERYFMPSLEEFSQRLGLSEDVAGATLMSAGSSAPELFTAILGVFVAKGDVGTGAIVGSAATTQLNWWPVLRDSVFYTFTVLVLILFIYDERITSLESFLMIALYGVYILIMAHNEAIKRQVTQTLQSYPLTAKLLRSTGSLDGADDVFATGSSSSANYQTSSLAAQNGRSKQTNIEEDSIYLAALLIIVKHKRLFGSKIRFQSAARYIMVKRQHKLTQQQKSIKCSNEVNYFGPESEPLRPSGASGNVAMMSQVELGSGNQRERMEAYARTATASKSKFSIVSKDDYEFWNRPPGEGENYYLWLAKIPVNYVLHYTIPDCSLYPDKYLFTFCISITWTALFSYIMVWMVTLIGYTFGIPDSVMGVTFLAAGTSVPDCYSSIHAAKNGMADMAVSNSIGSNVFDILIGLSLPWFIQTTIYPGVVATINSRGIIYSVILLFLSLIVTVYLLNKYDWTLKPRLGLALLIAYGLFIVLTCMLEFNLFGHVNPPPCPVQKEHYNQSTGSGR